MTQSKKEEKTMENTTEQFQPILLDITGEDNGTWFWLMPERKNQLAQDADKILQKYMPKAIREKDGKKVFVYGQIITQELIGLARDRQEELFLSQQSGIQLVHLRIDREDYMRRKKMAEKLGKLIMGEDEDKDPE